MGNYQELHDRVSALVVTESAQDGSVTVEVGADGTVRGLVLRDRGHSPDHCASVILECLSRAQARIPGLVAQEVEKTVGAADPGANLVLADLRKRFPEPAPAVRSTRRATEEDGDDWAGSRIMEDTI